MTYHENIRIYRNAAGMTQTELALKLGYTDRSSIAKIETNKMNVTVEQLEKIADVLGVAPVDLLCWNDSGAADRIREGKRTCSRGSCRVHFGPPQCSWDECVYSVRGRVYRHSVPA